MKKIFFSCILFFCATFCYGQTNYRLNTYKFADRDTCSLYMDLYRPADAPKINKTVIYVFGGGFILGDKRAAYNVEFYKSLVDNGFTVIAIDYRLGLKGVKNVGITNPKAPFKAVKIAVEDLISAVEYILVNSNELGVDTSKIVTIGSSAGAITVLQADYELANRTELVEKLPVNFKFAGVISMAGAVFSTKGMPKYINAPSPTFFLHGTSDKIVVYNKIQVFRLAMVGSSSLVNQFAKEGYPFVVYRYEQSGHEVAEFPRHYAFDQLLWFIDEVAYGNKKIQMDVTIRDAYVKSHFVSNVVDLGDLYKHSGNGN